MPIELADDRPAERLPIADPEMGKSPPSSRVDRRHRLKLDRALRLMLAAEPAPQVPLVLWVSGPPGCGRGTILREVRETHEAEGVRWLRGKAYPGTGEILEPILRAIRDLVGEIRERGRSEPEWLEVWRHISTDRAPALARVLPEASWGREIQPFPDLEPRYERSRLLDHLSGLVLAYAERTPLVLQIDGAEHLDGLSRDAIETLVRIIRTRRDAQAASLALRPPPALAILLVTGERETVPLRGPDSQVLHVPVRGLDRREFIRLIESEFGAEQPLSVLEKLYQLTKGNRYDLDRRLAWEAGSGDSGTPEERAKRLLEYGHFDGEVSRRVRRRPDGERQLLQTLAVLGKPVSVTIIERICGLQREEVAAMLGRLAGDDWIELEAGRVVRLHHERLRAPISDTLDEEALRRIHSAAAEAIAAEYEGRENRRFQEVYFHRARGPQDLSALEAAFAGAEEALRLYDFDGAIAIYRDLLAMLGPAEPEHLERGIGAIADVLGETAQSDESLLDALERLLERSDRQLSPPARAKLWRRLGHVAGRWGLSDRELDLYQRAYRTIGGYGRSQERVKIYAALARSFLGQHRLEETTQFCRQGLDLLSQEQLPSDPEFLDLCLVTEEVHFHRGEYVEAIAFEERYYKIALLQGTPMQQIESLLRLAHLHEKRGEPEAARNRLIESLPVARASGSRLLEARTQERLGHLHARRDEWPQAAAAYARAFEVHSEIGDEHRTIRILGSLGLVALALGDAADGAHAFRLYALYQQNRVRPEAPPSVPGFPPDYRSRSERDDEIRIRWRDVETAGVPPEKRCRSYLELGDLHRDCGEMEKARRCLRDGLRIALEQDLEPSRFYLRFGRLHRLSGDIAGALEFLQKGLDAMATEPERDRIAETTIQVGLLHCDRGDTRRGLSFLQRGLRAYLELEHEGGVAHSLVEISRVVARLGEVDAAEGLARAAITICASLDLPRLEGEAWLALGAARAPKGDGLQEIHAAGEIFSRLGILEARCRVLHEEANIRNRAGDFSEARALSSEAIEIARDLGLEPALARCLALRGRLEGTRTKRFLTAVRNLESALEHATRLGDRALAAECHRAQAGLYRERGSEPVALQHESAAEELERALRAENPFSQRAAERAAERAAQVDAAIRAADAVAGKAAREEPSPAVQEDAIWG